MRKTSLSDALYRLIYCSRSAIAGTPDRELGSIIDKATHHNTANGITGALLMTATGFAQVLEGRREIVERTFERISVDPRHTDVAMLSFTPAVRRGFPELPIALCRQTAPDVHDPLRDLLAGSSGKSGRRATTGSDVLRLLERLVRQQATPVPVE